MTYANPKAVIGFMTDDIGHILDTWPNDPKDDLTARIIEGVHGEKLQMRIDMGIIQMNLDGAPSGEHPDGFESWFEYYEKVICPPKTGQIEMV